MYLLRKILCIAIPFTGFIAVQAQPDAMLSRQQTISEPDSDCNTQFFRRCEKVESLSKIMLLTKTQRSVSLASFMASIYSHSGEFKNMPRTEKLPELQDYGIIDLDGDGKKELVISNFTGGAHCCDEFYFFRNIGPNKYQYVAKTFGGDVCVNEKNEFSYSFYEQFGYFFTCYACTYGDTTDEAPIGTHSILLRYSKGRLTIVPGDQELRSTINDNLGKLGEQPYEKLQDATSQDNGLRKEFAMNLAVFFHSFGRNMVETQKLFNKYYKFPDAKKVWSAFVKQLQWMHKDNDF